MTNGVYMMKYQEDNGELSRLCERRHLNST